MKKPDEILSIFEKYTPLVDNEIKALLESQPKFLMYDMMSYFFGYLGEDLKPIGEYGGKRFRPGICLLLSDFYGTLDKAVIPATTVEIFHNMTLIHDDIADNDSMRRGRPTVWKKWGINHGINTGDAQLMLVSVELNKFTEKYPELGNQIHTYLNQRFLEIAEGQFLDFSLSELPINDPHVTEEATFDMVARKSAILVGAPAVVAGMVAGKDEAEQKHLWEYGYNLGLTYQLCDDIESIWGNSETSGKDELADIREKKKTLPIIYLYNNASESKKRELENLYNEKGELTSAEVAEVKRLLDENGAQAYCLDRAREYLKKINESIEKLSITTEQREILRQINVALFPVLKESK
jgi:geranylgeranyl pyrophosphate synthase